MRVFVSIPLIFLQEMIAVMASMLVQQSHLDLANTLTQRPISRCRVALPTENSLQLTLVLITT